MSENGSTSENESKAIKSEINHSHFVEDGKNKSAVRCKFCKLKILETKSGNYLVEQKELPLMQQDGNKDSAVQNETVSEFYLVEDMYSFENIGFTHTVGKYKYLSCADCDAGPLGYHDMETKHSYVALSRIAHS